MNFMQELIMEIKCNFHPRYVNNCYTPGRIREVDFRGRERYLLNEVGRSADSFVKRPVADTSATGLYGFKELINTFVNGIKMYAKNYVKNIKHTYQHKIVFAMVEKALFGKNSKDSITHDLDKLILYTLGFPKSFVTKFHRKHSEHHSESGKKPNLRSMLCDNIASSPEFKPEKKLSLRDYYNSTPELQCVDGFGDILERYNYGENLDFTNIKLKTTKKYGGAKGFLEGALKSAILFITSII